MVENVVKKDWQFEPRNLTESFQKVENILLDNVLNI